MCVGGGEDILIKSPSILEDLTKGYHVIVLVQKCSDVCTELERMGYKRGETYECITFDEIAAEIENFEIIWACDRLCETKKCSVAFILFPHTVDIQNRSRLENALSGFDDMVEDRIGYLKSNPPYIALTHQELPYYSGEYIENIFTGKNPYRSSRGDVIQEEHKSQYVNVVNGMFE